MNKTCIRSRHFLALILTGIFTSAALWNGFPAQSALKPAVSPANDIARAETVFNTDFVSAGFGGMRTVGTGTIKLAGVSGQVTQALLFWHGPTNSSSADANATVMFNGTSVTATNIGFSQSNCWPFTNSQAYRADVTSQVKGNGNYSLGNFRKSNAEINGVSLIVFFNDGNPENNRDVVIFNGNDSNAPNSFDANGWTAAPDGLLRLGASGPRVREVQALLARAGFPVKVDGDFSTPLLCPRHAHHCCKHSRCSCGATSRRMESGWEEENVAP